MSFLTELKRRNVIRMAGLYLVAAWLIVQVAGTVLPMFGAPDWVARTIVLVLAIGFVPALVFAWLYEMTPEGLKRDGEVPSDPVIAARTGQRMDRLIFAGLIALILVIAANRYWPREAPVAADVAAAPAETTGESTATTEAPSAPASTAAKAAANGIAVLPFVNMSPDRDNEFFSDGISEELLNVLVRVEGLRVASRTSSFAYKGSELGSRRIAGELGVNYLLEGSVRKSGNTVRITAQLIEAGNDRHLWSETYDRDLTDIFAIQDEIAGAIVAALQEELAGSGAPLAAVKVEADTANLTAYETYLKARELFVTRTELPESIRLFERVVELDPSFARGWEGLASAYSIVESWGISDRDYLSLTIPAAERALKLDPTLAMPWAALGMVESSRAPSDWTQALGYMDKAIAADPNNATPYLWRAIVNLHLGYFDKAAPDLEHCLRLDPAYRNCVRWQATAAVLSGDDDRAMELFERGLTTGPFLNRQMDFIRLMHHRGERVGVRVLLYGIYVEPRVVNAMLAAMDDPSRTPEGAESMLDVRGTGMNINEAWQLPLLFGRFDKVLEVELPNVDSLIAWQRWPATWANSPEYKQLLRKLGLVDHWRKHGFPPQCRALAGDDFECRVGVPR